MIAFLNTKSSNQVLENFNAYHKRVTPNMIYPLEHFTRIMMENGSSKTIVDDMGFNKDLQYGLYSLNKIQGLNDGTSFIWMPLIVCSQLQTFHEHIGKRLF